MAYPDSHTAARVVMEWERLCDKTLGESLDRALLVVLVTQALRTVAQEARGMGAEVERHRQRGDGHD